MALTKYTKDIIDNFDSHKLTISIFLDLTKAFDCVNRKILLKKLHHYGVRGIPLQWFEQYLADRTQYVTYNNTASSTEKIDFGVP